MGMGIDRKSWDMDGDGLSVIFEIFLFWFGMNFHNSNDRF